MNRRGFTLLELTMSIAILSIVSGMLFVLANTMHNASLAQDAKMSTHDEARNAMMRISRELRNAQQGSVVVGANGASIQYRTPADADDNGVPVDAGGFLELGPVRTIQRDIADANGDGRTNTQVILNTGVQVVVLANDVPVSEDANNNAVLDGGEDGNFNLRLDRGLVFERVGTGVRVTVQSMRQGGPETQPMISTMSEIVTPRN